jgi:DNA-binding CsgD family transcriptional regulator
MISNQHLVDLIDHTYRAVLDTQLWPAVLNKLADAVGAHQVGMPSFDWQANVFKTIAPRMDPEALIDYHQHWAFRDEAAARAALRPVGEIYSLDDLLPREAFAATPVFNEYWRPNGCGLAAMGANLVREEGFSALICVFNAPGVDSLTSQQRQFFAAALPHVMRAVRLSRRFFNLEVDTAAFPRNFEAMDHGILLTDACARVVRANAAAKAALDEGDGIFLREGRLSVNGNPGAVQKLVFSCAHSYPGIDSLGGELSVPRERKRTPLHITVAPLRAAESLKAVPWTGTTPPVAIVSITDPDSARLQRENNLRQRFQLTPAEAALADEIMKGDGRKAAACRCEITDGTAKCHLAKIFEKTGTRRQAELIRLLITSSSNGAPS